MAEMERRGVGHAARAIGVVLLWLGALAVATIVVAQLVQDTARTSERPSQVIPGATRQSLW